MILHAHEPAQDDTDVGRPALGGRSHERLGATDRNRPSPLILAGA
jgi:hypothetical protein